MRRVPSRLIPAYLTAYLLTGVGLAVTFATLTVSGWTVLAAVGVVVLGFTIRAEERVR
jgi:hypothetical protein